MKPGDDCKWKVDLKVEATVGSVVNSTTRLTVELLVQLVTKLAVDVVCFEVKDKLWSEIEKGFQIYEKIMEGDEE